MTRSRSFRMNICLSIFTLLLVSCYFCRRSEDRLTFTCRGRCGQEVSAPYMPCSCSGLCLVYDKCCENMTQDCPDVISRGRQKFAPYIGSKIVCGVNGLHRIASCPGEIDSNTTVTSYPDVESEIFEKIKVEPRDLSHEELKRAVLNVPVTDSASGFTFLNNVIYSCYQSLGLTSQTLRWAVNFKYQKSTISEFGNFTYIYPNDPYLPIFDYKLLDPHVCNRRSVESCNEADSRNFSEGVTKDSLSKKCQEFAGYVVAEITGVGQRIYRNRFCAYCHHGQSASLVLKPFPKFQSAQNSFGLSVLMSLNQDGTLQLYSTGITISSWSSAVCANLDVVLAPNGNEKTNHSVDKKPVIADTGGIIKGLPSCRVAECFEGLALQPDGRCRGTYYGKIAFSDDLDLSPMRCWSAFQRIADFLICSLDILLGTEPIEYAEFAKVNVSIEQQLPSGKILYVVLFSFTASEPLARDVFAFSKEKIAPNFHKLALSFKMLQTYTRFHDLCPSYDQLGGMQKYAIKNVQDRPEIPDIATFRNGLDNLRGAIIDTNTSITVCGSNFYTSPNPLVLGLRCFEDFLHVKDVADMSNLQTYACANLLERKDAGFVPVGCYTNAQKSVVLPIKETLPLLVYVAIPVAYRYSY